MHPPSLDLLVQTTKADIATMVDVEAVVLDEDTDAKKVMVEEVVVVVNAISPGNAATTVEKSAT